MTEIDYNLIQDALDKLDIQFDSAQYHGTMCALLVAGGIDKWLLETIGERDNKDLAWLLESTNASLGDQGFDFFLLLPGEHSPLTDKVCALASWCDGFLYGFGLSAVKLDKLPDSSEILNDFAQISRLDFVNVDEKDELDLMELEEYVRMGVLLLGEDLRQLKLA